MRRPVEFLRSVAGAVPRSFGWSKTLLSVIAAAAAVSGASILAGPNVGLIATGVAVTGAVLISVYEAWSAWAPYDPPRLKIEPRRFAYGLMGIEVTNLDVDAVYRAAIIDAGAIDESGAVRPWQGYDLWPMPLGWGDDRASEPFLVRGESEKIPIADHSWGGGGAVYFRLADGKYKTMPSTSGETNADVAVEVTIRFVRVRPVATSALVIRQRLHFSMELATASLELRSGEALSAATAVKTAVTGTAEEPAVPR